MAHNKDINDRLKTSKILWYLYWVFILASIVLIAQIINLKVFWEPENEKLDMLDKLIGKGMIDAKYSLSKFRIEADYCENCKKMIFSTNISNSIIN